MIEVKNIASGSSGNCYLLTGKHGATLLIECGIRYETMQIALDYSISSLDGCLISHSHRDHSRSIDQLISAGINVYISQQTKFELILKDHHRIKVYKPEIFNICKWKVLPFKLQHDVENYGFMIDSIQGERVVYITDSYYCRYKFPDVNIYMIECNYDKDLLDENVKDDKVSRFLRDRVLRSHFSLENVLNFFRANDMSKCREIHLLHISKTNGDPEYFKTEVQKLTGIPTYV